ncbi:helix-hairpin-helix domain-containing protein [Bacillus suaedaesalsae]|uniref:helix-hairpin-helix domain-containing protein n=1 Tax=Bacillus suaedaesalsae TaxID=2810349 RepID=UPI003211939D
MQIGFKENRAKEIIALSIFQAIPSVGPGLANNVVNDLGYYDFEQIRGQRGEELILALEKKYGVWMDPCVEDGLRCIVYHANKPNSDKSWWDFTEERKAYRSKYGYPEDRPKKAWNE